MVTVVYLIKFRIIIKPSLRLRSRIYVWHLKAKLKTIVAHYRRLDANTYVIYIFNSNLFVPQ